MSFAIFDESFYLSNYPDVKAAVDAGVLTSGLQHFQQTGLAEGRVLVSPYYDEQFYLRANPDVAAAVAAGTYSSGLQHYIQVGQFEPTRLSLFLGTSGNDIITGFGQGIRAVMGVSYDNVEDNLLNGGAVAGVGEVDTLIGGEGSDGFVLGYPSISLLNSPPQQFYVGAGDTDYALIQNFEQFSDVIFLPGSTQDYNLQPVNGNLNIYTASGDLVGIVEGVTSLTPLPISGEMAAQLSGLPSGFLGPILGLA